MISSPPGLLAADITPGEHTTWTFAGLTFNTDTLWTTAIAGGIVIGLGLYMRWRGTVDGVPSKLQLAFEMLVDWVQGQVESSVGRIPRFVVPLGVTLFAFILTANWLEMIPSGHHPEYLPAPTADANLTYAMAITVIILVHGSSIRARGLRGYLAHYFQPNPWLFPINLIEELVKPVTLALRLFGNIFSGGIMVSLITMFPAWVLWGPNAVWKLFDMGIGFIQAFIFSLLTILYFSFATTTGHEDSSDAEGSAGHEGTSRRSEAESGPTPTTVPAT